MIAYALYETRHAQEHGEPAAIFPYPQFAMTYAVSQGWKMTGVIVEIEVCVHHKPNGKRWEGGWQLVS